MLLSIIIPTKDRYHYLKECITTVLSVNTDDFELIIQDNTADNSEIRDFCEEIVDSSTSIITNRFLWWII